MKKMSNESMRKLNGGVLKCPFCKKIFLFLPGWEKKYDKHVAGCR